MGLPRFCVPAIGSALVLMALPGTAYAVTETSCTYDAGVVDADVAGHPDEPPVTLDRLATGEIRLAGALCGAATVFNTDLIDLTQFGVRVDVDVTHAFGPGLTPEPDGIGEVEIEYSGDALGVRGGPGPDDLRAVAEGIHLNGDTDVDLRPKRWPSTFVVDGAGGDDVVDVSRPGVLRSDVRGGAGDDVVRGGPGAEALDGGDGSDRIVDGQSADVVRGGAGDDLLLAAEAATVDGSAFTAPDQGVATSSVAAPFVRDSEVEVRLTLAHGDVSTLHVRLLRGGQAASLVYPGATSGSGLHGTVFGDRSARSLADGAAPYSGRFRSYSGLLDRLPGHSVEPYVLQVVDTAADGNSATVLGWSLHVTGSGNPTGADSYDGGAGRDTLSYALRSAPVTVDARPASGPAGEAGEGDSVASATVEAYEGGVAGDTLIGSPRGEELRGGAGADTLHSNGGGDVLDCGGETDLVSFEGLPAGVRADLARQGGVATSVTGTATIAGCEELRGTRYDDVIVGSDDSDRIWALGGADRISSRGGYDVVDAGEGDDVVDEGVGYGFEQDTLSGGPGSDRLTYAGRSGSIAVGYDGPVGNPRDYVDRDRIDGFEHYSGGNADDAIVGDAAYNDIVGGPGNDLIDGAGGDDWLYGGDGNDTITGGAGRDMLFGQAGADTFAEGATASGADVVSGGADLDTVDYRLRTLAVSVTLGDATADGAEGEGDLVQFDVENAWGGSGDDVLTGSWAPNALYGYGGQDRVTGGPGVDVLDGGAGNDWLFARDLTAETVRGGDGVDVGQTDPSDAVTGVEVLLP